MIKYLPIEIIIHTPFEPPFFIGSMIRGVIGSALKRIVCVNPRYECQGCFASKECLYYDFYEEKNTFHKFRLGITLKPKDMSFTFYLFEDAIDALPYILAAVKKAFEEVGIGHQRQTLSISEMRIENQIVYDGTAFRSFDSIIPKELIIDTFCPEVVLEFTMPLRIKEQNRFAMTGISLVTLINNIHNRYREIKSLPREPLGYKIEGEIVHSTMKFVDAERYSNRQKTKMNMGGIKGIMHIKGLDKKTYQYLKIGEIISAGKQTVFGMGSYRLREIHEKI